MKKAVVAIVTLLYMSISTGMAMDLHYCMGKLIGIDLYANNTKKCDKCGMKSKKGCCGDQHKFYKLSDSHKNVSNDINFSNSVEAIIPKYYLNNTLLIPINTVNTLAYYSPPDYTKPPASILNCIFRI